MSLPSPITDRFQQAWELATRAGLSRPLIQVLPDPQLQQANPRAAWLLGRALSEADGFQRAVGDWIQSPALSPQSLTQALAGLRRGARGPAWYRRALAPWRAHCLNRWRAELSEEIQRCHRSQQDVSLVAQALTHIKQGLAGWTQWSQESVPAEAMAGWSSRSRVLMATLDMLEQRLELRQQVDGSQLHSLQDAMSLVEMVRHAKGAGADQAWAAAAQQASSTIREQQVG